MEKIAIDKKKLNIVVSIIELCVILFVLNVSLQMAGAYNFERRGEIEDVACVEKVEIGNLSWQKYFMHYTCEYPDAGAGSSSCDGWTGDSGGCVECANLKFQGGKCIREYWYDKDMTSPTLFGYLEQYFDSPERSRRGYR